MFKSKFQNYELYRPNYPRSLLEFFKQNRILKQTDLVAEFGLGTGKFTDLLLSNGNKVWGVEYEREMFDFSQKKYRDTRDVVLINKPAEDSGLLSDTYDIALSAQAFHLFDAEKAKREFYRVLKINGVIILIWYHWDMSYDIAKEIMALFYKYGTKQKQQIRLNIGKQFFDNIFSPNKVNYYLVDTIKQRFSKDHFLKSMLSSSYAATNEENEEYLNEAGILFDTYSIDGEIEYSFNLEVYYVKIENKNF